MKFCVYGLLAGVLFFTGCSSSSMKGTPFYTQEYDQHKKPDPNRVNLGVVSYRDPVLHVLGPLMEFGPKYVAVRPLYSVHDRDTDSPVYNVLWPLARFDPGSQDYRIFPVYWGDEYFNVFPLYYHEGDPFSGNGMNALFPLWIWDADEAGDYLSVFWPLYARHRFPEHQAWRLWPLYGTQLKNGRQYRYAAWPFIHAYSNAVHTGHGTVPLYWFDQTPERSTFVSLPYSRSMTEKAGATSWDLMLPLGYRQWKGDDFLWEVYPALSWGWRDAQRTNSWYALGLGHHYRSDSRNRHHALPLYYCSKDERSRSFYTLPWWSKTYADGTGWHSLVPMYYRGRYEDSTALYTLPWWSKTYADGTGWHSLVPIYYRSRYEDATALYTLPWCSKTHSDGSGWQTSIPFYFYSHTDHASTFYSLPWLSEKHADGSEWQASFPFYFRSQSTDGSLMLTPFYARRQHGDGSTAWQCIIPLVYMDKTYDEHFLTLLGGRWRMGNQYNWLALPLLSGGAKDADSGRNIWLGGLGGQHWTGNEKSHYILPLYYTAPSNGHFISIPYAAWRMDDRQHHAIPLLVSGWYSKDNASGSFLLAGLAGHRKGSAKDYSYLMPIYYSAPNTGTLLSLPYTTWSRGDRKNHVILPLLSGWYTDGAVSGSTLALGLAGHRSGDEKAYHYVVPFYYNAPSRGTFVSLPYAAWQSGGKQNQAVPLLLSGWRTDGNTSDKLLLGGTVHWKKRDGQIQGSHVLPFYLWSRDTCFYTALFGKNRKLSYYATPLIGRFSDEGKASGSWALPLYYHRRNSSGSVNGYYFPLGYYSKDQDAFSHGLLGIYNRSHRKYYDWGSKDRHLLQEKRSSSYLMDFAGSTHESWSYSSSEPGGEPELSSYRKSHSLLGVLWNSTVNDQLEQGTRVEESALLALLYDARHEQERGEKSRDYQRRRILWRVYHYEKLNGDVSVDVFPGITVDSYTNGYHQSSFLWRLFRYEKDPENGRTKLDLLFIPIKR